MEILYYWVEEKGRIRQQSFNLSPELKCDMSIIGDKYFLSIEKTGKLNIMRKKRSGVISNVTMLVGDNGAGKTTLMKCLSELTCFSEKEENGSANTEFIREKNKRNRCLYVTNEDGKYIITTNIHEQRLELTHHGIIDNVRYYSDNSSLLSSDLANNRGIHGITAICITNTAYSFFSDSIASHDGLTNISFSPETLNATKDAFFDFVYPDVLNGRKETLFDDYSYNLRKSKGIGQFQQLCDLYYCAFACNHISSSQYAILDKDSYVIKASNFFGIYDDFLIDQKIQKGNNYQKGIEQLKSLYEIDKAKDSVLYVIKSNFVAEYLISQGNITKALSEYSDIESIFEDVKRCFIENRISVVNEAYFRNAIDEIEELEKILMKASLRYNSLPKTDYAYKTGCILTNGPQINDYYYFIKKCLEYNSKLQFQNNITYGSFCLRYLGIDELYLSSGERAFQNLISWLYWVSKMGNIASVKSIIPKKNMLVCIDEIDDLCHPDWQRDILGNIIETIEECFIGYSIQLIVSTHSPLCLSNIPVENTVYLRNDENGIHQYVGARLQTFGRNIYDILNDAYYLNNQTIGGYAIAYINDLVKYIDNEKTEQLFEFRKELYERIEYIGDPLIKQKLLQITESKMSKKTKKQMRKENLRRQIRIMQDELRMLENADD